MPFPNKYMEINFRKKLFISFIIIFGVISLMIILLAT